MSIYIVTTEGSHTAAEKVSAMQGLTLRDLFAMAALNGFVRRNGDDLSIRDELRCAKASYRWADHMLAAREGGAK